MTKILEERADYGKAWSETGEMLLPVSGKVVQLLLTHPKMWYAWVMIFNKAVRALSSPTKEDHYVDIIGYAELILLYLRGLEAKK